MSTMKPRVIKMGKTVIEEHDGEWLVMHPSGEVVVRLTRIEAEKCARKWIKRNTPDDAIAIAVIEWC